MGGLTGVGEGVRSRSSLSAEEQHFSSTRKKHFYFTKSFPNGICGCVERGFYKKITWSPVSGDQVIRCCSDLLFLPKRDFILKESLFLDGANVQIIKMFIRKVTHRLSALPQPCCSLFESPLSSLLSPCQPCSCPAAWFFSRPPTWYHSLQAFLHCWEGEGWGDVADMQFQLDLRRNYQKFHLFQTSDFFEYLEYFVKFSSSHSRSIRVPWNE